MLGHMLETTFAYLAVGVAVFGFCALVAWVVWRLHQKN
jgi:hypothetical protein